MTEENSQQPEEKIVLGGRANEIVNCSTCGKEISVSERHSYEGENGEDIYFCDECMEKINKEIAQETQNPNMIGASVMGGLAGVLGGIIWFLITAITKTAFGIIAIGLGWLIGKAVSLGAGNKKGIKLQILAASMMTIFLLLSEYFIFLHFLGKDPSINASASVLLLLFIKKGWIIKSLGLFVKNFISPIGLVIWGFGIYMAYIVPKPTKI